MLGMCRSSAKTNVFGSAVARIIRSAAARGALASLDRRMYDSSALIARCCSMVQEDALVVSGSGESSMFGCR